MSLRLPAAARSRFAQGAFGGALLLALLGCGPTAQVLSREATPTAEVRSLQCGAFSPQRTELVLEVALASTHEALKFDRADYSVLVEGRPFAVGVATIDSTVAAGGQALLKLPIRLAHLDWPQRVKSRARQGEPVVIVARGVLRGQAAARPISVEFAGETTANPSAAEAPEEP